MTTSCVDSFVQCYQMTRGPRIKAQFYLGDRGILKVQLAPSESEHFEWEVFDTSSHTTLVSLIEEWVESFCKKQQPPVFLPLMLQGLPPYTTRVLSILREIPLGVSLTYEALAEISGSPKGARAVGNACAKNPFPLIIPCHRVLASRGHLGGFSCGLEIKKSLLKFEEIEFRA